MRGRLALVVGVIALVAVLAGCGGGSSSSSSDGGGSATTRPTSTASACRASFLRAKSNGIWSDKTAAYAGTLTACKTVNVWLQVAKSLNVPTFSNEKDNLEAASVLDDALCVALQAGDTPVCTDASAMNPANG